MPVDRMPNLRLLISACLRNRRRMADKLDFSIPSRRLTLSEVYKTDCFLPGYSKKEHILFFSPTQLLTPNNYNNGGSEDSRLSHGR